MTKFLVTLNTTLPPLGDMDSTQVESLTSQARWQKAGTLMVSGNRIRFGEDYMDSPHNSHTDLCQSIGHTCRNWDPLARDVFLQASGYTARVTRI